MTICGIFQSPEVKVTEAGDTTPSAVLLDDKPMVTSAVGGAFSSMVNVAVPPDSVVVNTPPGRIVIPAESLSTFTTETSAASRPSYAESALTAGAVMIVYATFPSITASSTPVTTTV